MFDTVAQNTFIDGLKAVYDDTNFSYEAKKALFDYYEQYETDTGESLEFDPIAICCEWGEYDEEELIKDYNHILSSEGVLDDDLSDHFDELVTELENNTQVIEVAAGFTYVSGERVAKPTTWLIQEF